MIHGIDTYLDAVKSALIHPTAGVAEFTTANVTVWHHGASDPDEDIQAGIAKCRGVSALIYDLGGDNESEDADEPVITAKLAIELYVDTTKRRDKPNTTYRSAGAIRDAVMSCLHGNESLYSGEHDFYSPVVTGYRPVADAAYVVFRITLQRSITIL